MDENKHLADALAEAGLTQVELGETVSDHLRAHGHAGTVGDRTVRNWLTGKTVGLIHGSAKP